MTREPHDIAHSPAQPLKNYRRLGRTTPDSYELFHHVAKRETSSGRATNRRLLLESQRVGAVPLYGTASVKLEVSPLFDLSTDCPIVVLDFGSRERLARGFCHRSSEIST